MQSKTTFHDVAQLGDPVAHRGVVIAPLFPRSEPVAGYLTLDEALPRGFRIEEASEAGLVPELLVVNPLDERVLLYDGEELVGACCQSGAPAAESGDAARGAAGPRRSAG